MILHYATRITVTSWGMTIYIFSFQHCAILLWPDLQSFSKNQNWPMLAVAVPERKTKAQQITRILDMPWVLEERIPQWQHINFRWEWYHSTKASYCSVPQQTWSRHLGEPILDRRLIVRFIFFYVCIEGSHRYIHAGLPTYPERFYISTWFNWC